MIGFIGYVEKCELKLSKEVDSADWVHYSKALEFLFPDSAENSAFAIYKKYVSDLNLRK